MIRTKVGQFELEADNTQEMDRLIEWAKEKGPHAQSVTVQDAQALLNHVRLNPGHSKYYLSSKKGGSFSKALIASQIKAGELQLHETVYEKSPGEFRTTMGVYSKDAEPFVIPWNVRNLIARYIAKHNSPPFDEVTERCGIPRTQAKKALTAMMLNDVVESEAGLLVLTESGKLLL